MSITTEAPARAGGSAVWSPKVTPPIGRDLTPEQELACAFRILARGGFSEDIAGHITWARDDGSLMINPWGLWWDEMTASDVCRVDYDGKVLSGKWDVTPAFHIHTEVSPAWITSISAACTRPSGSYCGCVQSRSFSSLTSPLLKTDSGIISMMRCRPAE